MKPTILGLAFGLASLPLMACAEASVLATQLCATGGLAAGTARNCDSLKADYAERLRNCMTARHLSAADDQLAGDVLSEHVYRARYLLCRREMRAIYVAPR